MTSNNIHIIFKTKFILVEYILFKYILFNNPCFPENNKKIAIYLLLSYYTTY